MKHQPNFFLVGAPKCGTSAMRHYLNQHPQVFFSVPEEPGFFDGPLRYPDKRDYQFKTLEQYLNIFRRAQPGQHKVIGEGSVYIMYTLGAIESILEMTSDAKFLVMLRNPIDAFVSMHGENHKSPKLGREPFPDIEEAWADLPRRGEERSIAGVHPFRFRYDVLFRYFEPVKNLVASIPPGNLKIVLYDDFVKDNIGTFQAVCEFFDIDRDFRPLPKRINARSQSRQNVVSALLGYTAIASRRVPLLRPLRGRGLSLNRFTQMPLPKPVLSESFVDTLLCFFADDIQQLANLIDRDLTAWCERTTTRRLCA